MAFLRTHSKNLYMMDELYSALQKDIRRGNMKQVLFWGGEFVNSGNPNPLWNRLFVIAVEDISIGQPHTSIALWNYYTKWNQYIKSKKITAKNSYSSPIANQYIIDALKYVTLSYKNRIINNSLAYVTSTYQLEKILLPISQLPNLPFKLFVDSKYETSMNYLYKLWSYYLISHEYEKAIFCGDVILQIKNKLKLNISPNPFEFMKIYNQHENLKELMNNLYLITTSDLGSSRLTLTFMIYLVIHYDLIKNILNSDPIISDGYEEYFYNTDTNILKRRIFAIPDYAIDKHTGRGKGSKLAQDDFHLLEKEAKKRNIDIDQWSMTEKSKSHGPYVKFANEYVTQQKIHSAVSYFFAVGSLVTHIRNGPTGEDPYFEKAMSAYLTIEFEKGYKSAKSTQMLQSRWPSILKFIENPQIFIEMTTKLKTAKSPIPISPKVDKILVNPKVNKILVNPKVDKISIQLKSNKIPIQLKSNKIPIQLKPNKMPIQSHPQKKESPKNLSIPTIENKYLEGLDPAVISKLKILAAQCSHYKDNKNKIYNSNTKRCVTIDGNLGKKIIEKLVIEHKKFPSTQKSEKIPIKSKMPTQSKIPIQPKSEKIVAKINPKPSPKPSPEPSPKKITPIDTSTNNKSSQIDTESGRFDFIVRAQLVTSMSKMDTYYAKDIITNKVVFVKGPYPTQQSAEKAIISAKLKMLLGISFIPVEMVMLKPDLLETPLGVRKSLGTTIKRPFLIFDNLCGDKFAIKIKESKLWQPTEVVDWEKMTKCQIFNIVKEKNDHLIKQYIEQILYRYIVGAGDLADRNFMMAEGKIYSVDEDSLGKEVNLCSSLKKTRTTIIKNFVHNHKKYFENLIDGWKFTIKSDEEFIVTSNTYYNLILKKISNMNINDMWNC